MQMTHHEKLLKEMLRPDFYPHPAADIQLRQTHISSVILAGPYVYKIKKPVDLGFLDFTTLEKRKYYCSQEIKLNNRLSRNVYMELMPITQNDRTYELNASGSVVEYAVVMHRLNDNEAMDQQLKQGLISKKDILNLAGVLVSFYSQTSVTETIHIAEAAQIAGQPAIENFKALDTFVGTFVDREKFNFVSQVTHDFLKKHHNLFALRVQDSKIRDCHGDLRTDHIYFTNGGIQIIDCIEFSDQLRCQDIISDLAFLIMDLEAIGALPEAQALLDFYIKQSKDFGAVALLDFYRCYRAMVRCKVCCLTLRQTDPRSERHVQLAENAEKYLSMAHAYAAAFSSPVVWAVCGLPASGKSTVARQLAGLFDLKWLRSDEIRKKIFGDIHAPTCKKPFGEGLYSSEATARTYDRMISLAGNHLSAGKGVVLDATFSTTQWREAVIQMAGRYRANLIFVECKAPEATLASRLKKRDIERCLSDARIEHLTEFKSRFEPLILPEDILHIAVNTQHPIEDTIGHIVRSRDLIS